MPGRLQSVKSYALYYGHGGEDRLAAYDLVVVDPGGPTPGGVARLKARGAVALAYVSVLEVPQHPGQAPPPNVLTDRGAPVANTAFGNWVLDPRQAATCDRLLRLAGHALGGSGYDGLFLDTLADVEDFPLTPALAAELVPAAARLVAAVAHGVLVQNRGFHRLLPLTSAYLDGLCWEAFPYEKIGPDPQVHSGIRVLTDLQKRRGVRILALNESTEHPAAKQAARSAAAACGFLWYGTGRYTDLPEVIS